MDEDGILSSSSRKISDLSTFHYPKSVSVMRFVTANRRANSATNRRENTRSTYTRPKPHQFTTKAKGAYTLSEKIVYSHPCTTHDTRV